MRFTKTFVINPHPAMGQRPKQTMSDNKTFVQDSLAAHNDYRRKHGVAPLKLNKDITAISQKWAEYLAKNDKFEHSSPSQRQYGGDQMGENIAMKWSSSNVDFTGQQSTDQWYSEIERFNFDTASGPSTGHFTQVVWKGSSELGVGRAQTKSGKWLVVANYHPAGNYIGEYKANVLPPTSGKVELPKKDDMPTEAGTIRPMSDGDQITSTGTQTSIRKEITTKADGTKIIKTIVTETKIGPDGKKTTTTRETITEGSDDGATAEKKTKGQKAKASLCCGRPRKGDKGKKTQSMKQFIDEVVKFHNKYRKTHGKVGDLKHNKELSVLAQSWAERMAATSALGHSNNIYKGKEVGENVATKWSSQGADYLGSEVVDQWYKESDKYDFTGDFQQGTGHFTQVVWKNSKEIGVGKAFSKDGRVFVVCNYHPAGNVLTTFKDNVYAAKK